MTELKTDAELKMEVRKQKVRDFSKIYYKNKIHEDPEFYAKEKLRVKEYKRIRYQTDPEFAEKIKAKRREYYQLKQSKAF